MDGVEVYEMKSYDITRCHFARSKELAAIITSDLIIDQETHVCTIGGIYNGRECSIRYRVPGETSVAASFNYGLAQLDELLIKQDV